VIHPTATLARSAPLSKPQGLAYGAPALALAFVALPLYVQLPARYAVEWGVPLGALGAVLLAVRAMDAVADPWIGRAADRLLNGAAARLGWVLFAAALLMMLGFVALFFPLPRARSTLLLWCLGCLALTTLGHSGVTLIHQAWGARLGGDAHQRTQVVAWREGLALWGVLLASVLPALLGWPLSTAVFAAALAVGLLALWRWAPRAAAAAAAAAASPGAVVAAADATPPAPPHASPLHNPAFRRLLAVLLLNGTASAVPATLLLFFVRDRLRAPALEPVFLASYFAAAALALPLWVRAVARFGLARSWGLSMLLAVAVFGWTVTLGAGDGPAFVAVCLLSGLAFGADLALPSALLTGVIRDAGGAAQSEGAYLGWWNFASKLNLALSAGLALPLLQGWGYAPGHQDPAALQALTLAYGVLPCVLKLLALVLLWALWIRPESLAPLIPPPARTPP
jgi:GPH family glycoside/pentoside/hexuronide:cation symporter